MVRYIKLLIKLKYRTSTMKTVKRVRHAYEDKGQAMCQEKQSAKRSLLMEFPKSWSYVVTVVIALAPSVGRRIEIPDKN